MYSLLGSVVDQCEIPFLLFFALLFSCLKMLANLELEFCIIQNCHLIMF